LRCVELICKVLVVGDVADGACIELFDGTTAGLLGQFVQELCGVNGFDCSAISTLKNRMFGVVGEGLKRKH
jgi:hypothetical protein